MANRLRLPVFENTGKRDMILVVLAHSRQALEGRDPMQSELSSGPIPDCMSTFGVLMAPSERMTSWREKYWRRFPSWMTSTPTAEVPSKMSLLTKAW